MIGVSYTPFAHLGYGRFGVELVRALRAHTEVYEHRIAIDPKPDPVPQTMVYASFPAHAPGWYEGQRRIAFTMWEATHVPESFRQTLHQFDVVLVPSHQNVDIFSPYNPETYYVPLGINPEEWHYVPRQDGPFTVLTAGSGKRKGIPHPAVDVFKAAFPRGEERMVVKDPKGETNPTPRIEVIPGFLSASDERALYARCHVYLSCSHGEGFGLQPLQALAQGMPAVIPDHSGHASFAGLGFPVGWKLTKAARFAQGEAGSWWQPNFDEMVDQLRWIRDNYDEALSRMKRSAVTVANEWTWDHTARGALEHAVLGDYGGSGVWMQPEPIKFEMKVTKRVSGDFGGQQLTFLPGKLYRVPADIKRICQDAGYVTEDTKDTDRAIRLA